jgi:hypothetical protein
MCVLLTSLGPGSRPGSGRPGANGGTSPAAPSPTSSTGWTGRRPRPRGSRSPTASSGRSTYPRARVASGHVSLPQADGFPPPRHLSARASARLAVSQAPRDDRCGSAHALRRGDRLLRRGDRALAVRVRPRPGRPDGHPQGRRAADRGGAGRIETARAEVRAGHVIPFEDAFPDEAVSRADTGRISSGKSNGRWTRSRRGAAPATAIRVLPRERASPGGQPQALPPPRRGDPVAGDLRGRPTAEADHRPPGRPLASMDVVEWRRRGWTSPLGWRWLPLILWRFHQRKRTRRRPPQGTPQGRLKTHWNAFPWGAPSWGTGGGAINPTPARIGAYIIICPLIRRSFAPMYPW